MEIHGIPISLLEHQPVFSDDAACSACMEAMRSSERFVCGSCGVPDEPYGFVKRSSLVLCCRSCRKKTQRQIWLNRYETTFTVQHDLHTCMARAERDTIGDEHAAKVDDCYVGEATCGEGRDFHTSLASSEAGNRC